MFIIELILQKIEITILLDSIGQQTLVGMPADAFRVPDHLKRNVAIAGAAGLVDKKLAEKVSDGSLAIDADLQAIVKVAADAELAVVIEKDIPLKGKQVIVQGAMNNAVVEHTRPTQETHRLAVMRSQASLPLRWAELLPMSDDPVEGRVECGLGEFQKIVALANTGSFNEAINQFPANAESGLVRQLVKDINSPQYSANIAFLWRDHGKIVDARNLMILASNSGVWLITQVSPGCPRIQIERVNRAQALHEMVKNWKAVAERRS